MYTISTSATHFTENFSYDSKLTLYCGLSELWCLIASYVYYAVVKKTTY